MTEAASVAGLGGSGLPEGFGDLQSTYAKINQEFNQLASACKALRAEQVQLTTSTNDQRSILSAEVAELTSEINDLTSKRESLRVEVAEEKEAGEWWRKKEETQSKRTGDVPGRLARSAWMAEERSKHLQKEIDELKAEYEAELEKEKAISAGLRDRIGRLEGKIRDKEAEIELGASRESEVRRELGDMAEGHSKEKAKMGNEIEDLKAALFETRSAKSDREAEVERLAEALRDSNGELRMMKATASLVVPPARVLTPQNLNISRPQTPPRNATQMYNLKSPSTILHSPGFLARSYAYLEKRHTEAQAHNQRLEASLQRAQATLQELHDQHKLDREKFLEWRKIEDERSQVRKRKREERRRERGETGDQEDSAGKRRKSGEGEVLVDASDESAPSKHPPRLTNGMENHMDEEAHTSQTVEEDGAAPVDAEVVEHVSVEMPDEEEEEEQDYYSPSDVFIHPTTQRQPVSLGISQRPGQATAVEARPRSRGPAESSQRQGPARPRESSQAPTALAQQWDQDTRGRTQRSRPRVEPANVATSSRTNSATRRDTGRLEIPTQSHATPREASQSRQRSMSPDKSRRVVSSSSRRSTSPHKMTPANPVIRGASHSTPWLGGGNLVRTSSKPNLMTSVDPFDLSPPETSTLLQSRTKRQHNNASYSTPTAKPSLVRDRGKPSLRRTALTRNPSDMSTQKGCSDSPKLRSASELGGESIIPGSQSPNLGLEGLSPEDKARKLKALNKLSTSEKREVYRGYKQEGGRYLGVDQVRRPMTDAYEIDPAKNEGKSHQFHDVKRRKEDRKCMHGGDCEECRDWYEAIGPIPRFNQAPAFRDDPKADDDEEAEIRRHQNMVSRHRETWVKPPTPPGFWAIGFPTTQDVELQNKRADAMEREKEERMMRDAKASNSKWRKKI